MALQKQSLPRQSWIRRHLLRITTISLFGANSSRLDVEAIAVELSDDRLEKGWRELYDTVMNNPSDDTKRLAAKEFQWYIRFLQFSMRSLTSFLDTNILEDGYEQEDGEFLSKSCELLVALAKTLSSGKQLLGLESIRRELSQTPLLKAISSDSHTHITLFSMIGWLSMLYRPTQAFSPSLDSTEPALTLSSEDSFGELFKTNIYRQTSISLSNGKASGLQLQHVLAQFGQFVPEPKQVSSHHATDVRVDVFQEQLVVSYLNFQTLHQFAGIRISWVDCISLHLDFDEKTRRLKVFRFPSFCKMLCVAAKQEQHESPINAPYYMSSLFSELLPKHSREASGARTLTAPDLYKEVLLSYRIIFGQEKKSWKAWRKYCREEVSRFEAETADPLLARLCGKSCDKEQTYKEIDAPERAQQYSAQEDFPFFGQRLVAVQQFVLKKDPSDWRTLWIDRRDILRYYTFWAVVVVGAVSLFFSFIQVIEGGLQTAYTIKQNSSTG